MASPPDIAILIVDDKPNNLFALEQTLKGTGARIVKATSGEEALALTLHNEFSLAVLDVQMPGMDGFELAELLLGSTSSAGLPIIFITAAFQDEAHLFKGYSAGAVDYLVKPVDPAVLVGKAKVFLELAKARAELEALVRERTRDLEAKAELLSRRNGFRELLSGVSKELMLRSPTEALAGVEGALATVSRYIGAAHGFLRMLPTGVPGEHAGHATAEWFRPGDGAAADGGTSFRPTLILIDDLRRGEGLVVPSLAELPSPAADDRERLQRLGVRSLLLFPIMEQETVLGLVGFDWRGPTGGVRADLPEQLAILPDLVHATVRRAASEAACLETRAAHRILFETMAQGVVFQDAGGHILAANPAAERILGLTLAQLAGREPADPRCHAVDQDGFPVDAKDHPAMVALRTGRSVSGVVLGVFNPRDNAQRWLMVDAVPQFRPGEATPHQVYTTFSDLTELKQATAEKERLMHVEAESKAKSQFLATMSHEIRTPMNAVLGYSQLLLREPGLSARQREYLETIDRSGDHLLTLINNVLDMARMEAGAERLDAAPADFSGVLTDAERMFRLRAAEKRLAFQVVRAGSVPGRIVMDAGKVRQVLINLVGNAMKFTAAGSITVTASASEPAPGVARVVLEVADTGTGIPARQVENIFSPFVQVAPGAGRTGSGLGLAVSRRFAQLMGGGLTATSRVGEGSTFRFWFEAPLADAEAPQPAAPRAVGLAPGSPVAPVLVVEDDADNLVMLTRSLQAVGLPVREADGAGTAVAAFVRERCGIVVANLHLPDGDALDVMRRIHALPGGAGVPMVVVSASALAQDRDAALSAGAGAFLGKPVRERALLDELSRLAGFRFLYEGDEAVVAPAGGLSRDAVLQLPAVRRAALLKALRRGYIDEITAEIDALAGESPPGLAAEIRKLADGFKYSTLAGLLAGPGGTP